MKKSMRVLKGILFIATLCLSILFFNQSSVKATTLKTINTMEELKKVFEEKATIEGNTIKLTDNVIIKDNSYDIKIPELIIDFNGKTIECKETIYICNKAIVEDNSTTNRSNWGGIIFSTNNSVNVREEAELIINNGKFTNGNKDLSLMLHVKGKLTINYAIFYTNKEPKEVQFKNTMINLGDNCEVVINDGDFSHVAKIIDDSTESNPYKHNYKLTINGGNFKTIGNMPEAIGISALYPYVDENNNKQVITPKVVLRNCNVESETIAISFTGGSIEEEFKNINTKILTILSGNYKCTKSGIAAFDISCHLSPFTYFNPKDINIQNGVFEAEHSRSSITLGWTDETENLKQLVKISWMDMKVKSIKMMEVIVNMGWAYDNHIRRKRL